MFLRACTAQTLKLNGLLSSTRETPGRFLPFSESGNAQVGPPSLARLKDRGRARSAHYRGRRSIVLTPRAGPGPELRRDAQSPCSRLTMCSSPTRGEHVVPAPEHCPATLPVDPAWSEPRPRTGTHRFAGGSGAVWQRLDIAHAVIFRSPPANTR